MGIIINKTTATHRARPGRGGARCHHPSSLRGLHTCHARRSKRSKIGRNASGARERKRLISIFFSRQQQRSAHDVLRGCLALQTTAKPFLTASSAVSLVGSTDSLLRRQAFTSSTTDALLVTRIGLASVSCSAWRETGQKKGTYDRDRAPSEKC